MPTCLLIVLMGVSGSGKSSIGHALSSVLNSEFVDADDFHSNENKIKMSKGIPLSDQDRFPWLLQIQKYVASRFQISNSLQLPCSSSTNSCTNYLVLACSALKKSYRSILSGTPTLENNSSQFDVLTKNLDYKTVFVLLSCSKNTLLSRLKSRTNHFVNQTLLDSQLKTLETLFSPTDNAIFIDTENKSISVSVHEIYSALQKLIPPG
ncbi:hypothetical protein BB560_002794 [Smittium megazygosporum]|uniref:Gluconokinase n=1 Tax=Smittium megazygosporum TaxID=133381 RepID=A0A2T9ZDQ9_9FUNG|nr:hypothetical protein BB560_002794 [Smittium megazygosporum]